MKGGITVSWHVGVQRVFVGCLDRLARHVGSIDGGRKKGGASGTKSETVCKVEFCLLMSTDMYIGEAAGPTLQ